MNAHTAAALRDKTDRFTVICASALPPDDVRRMGMLPAADLGEAIAMARRGVPADAELLVIPQGGLALPVLSA
jgi:hypothetical protein